MTGPYNNVVPVSSSSAICTSPAIELARPGILNFFHSEHGKTLLSGIETNEKSCIQLDMLRDGTEHELENAANEPAAESRKLCSGTTKEGKVIALVQGDITELPTDVIVNAANAELKHIGGVAFAILKKGGPIIQEESNRFIYREGKLSDGDAVMTKSVGKLPCKHLIHAVGPKWNGGFYNEEAFLKNACLESLNLATSYRMLSFPAISSGVFGFPMSRCASCMMKAFQKYSANNPQSTLCEITVVVRDQSAITAFTNKFSQCLDNFQDATKTSIPSKIAEPPRIQEKNSISHSKHKKLVTKATPADDQDNITQFIQLHRGELLNQMVILQG